MSCGVFGPRDRRAVRDRARPRVLGAGRASDRRFPPPLSLPAHRPPPSPRIPFLRAQVEEMKKVARLATDQELSVEERNLLSVAFKNVIGSRRASWRIISSIEQKEESKGNEENVKRIKKYREVVRVFVFWRRVDRAVCYAFVACARRPRCGAVGGWGVVCEGVGRPGGGGSRCGRPRLRPDARAYAPRLFRSVGSARARVCAFDRAWAVDWRRLRGRRGACLGDRGSDAARGGRGGRQSRGHCRAERSSEAVVNRARGRGGGGKGGTAGAFLAPLSGPFSCALAPCFSERFGPLKWSVTSPPLSCPLRLGRRLLVTRARMGPRSFSFRLDLSGLRAILNFEFQTLTPPLALFPSLPVD